MSANAKCPIDAQARQWMDWRWAWLNEQFGAKRPRSAPVILPAPDFFPDAYDRSDEDVQVLLDRVCAYMNIDPSSVDLAFYEDRNPVRETEWRHGSEGLYYEDNGRFCIGIEDSARDDALGLVATLAHELGHVHLLGHGRIAPDADDHELLTDLLTVFLGMGVFTANAVLHERYWDSPVESHWQMKRRGYLTMPMYGYALALLARARGENAPAWATHLRPDVRSAFDESMRFLAEQGPIAAPEGPVPAPAASLALESPPLDNGVPYPDAAGLSHELDDDPPSERAGLSEQVIHGTDRVTRWIGRCAVVGIAMGIGYFVGLFVAEFILGARSLAMAVVPPAGAVMFGLLAVRQTVGSNDPQ